MVPSPDEPLPAAVVVETITGESVQQLLMQGQKIGDDAAKLVEEVRRANERDKRRQRRRDRWQGAVLAVIAVGVAAAITFGVLNLKTNSSNQDVLERIDRNQQGIDELVAFVRDLKSQPPSNGTSEAVEKVITVLCASSDPVRVEACAALTTGGSP